MAAWHRSRRADWALRGGGLILWAIAYAAITHLCAAHPSALSPGATALALATIGFLGASAGTALVMLGGHLFDEVEVSARWRMRSSIGVPEDLEE
ncbi:hypothetical protein [Sphingomonas sp. Leaf21]|jgi:hypothetical protein|uniref:hypothetical protein n=1 Tax=Sphingomonas sp. Leaf21 TaxID=2876550 RepID=UPI001E5E8452|nr:hypothetical protein [Sphingomonas sp. Leaf21]